MPTHSEKVYVSLKLLDFISFVEVISKKKMFPFLELVCEYLFLQKYLDYFFLKVFYLVFYVFSHFSLKLKLKC